MEKTSLIIVESPAKARTIGKMLGSKYTVKSSLGHVMDLPKSKFGVELSDGFKPTYVRVKGKAKVLRELQEAAKRSDKIFLATDPDREGEAIAWHISNALKLKEGDRIEFHEITKPAILEALKNPRAINEDLVNAQQARRILDRIVGYKISPVLWRKVKGGSRNLSAGRVQSVALRLVVDREEEIIKFVKEEYWTVHAKLQKAENNDETVFEAKLHTLNNEKVSIKTKEEAQKIVDVLGNEDFVVSKVTIKQQKRNPFPPLITSTLQQEANKRFGFTAYRTMGIAQSLYEGLDVGEGALGLITYMRTDSVSVSPLAQNEAREYIGKIFGKDFIPEKPPYYKSRKTAQEAHEAIRPTSVFRTPEKMRRYLNADQFALYSMIYYRFLSSQMKHALLSVSSIDIKAGPSLFKASGSILLFEGFLKVYAEAEKHTQKIKDTEEKQEEKEKHVAEEENEEAKLPQLKEYEKLLLRELNPIQHFTQPPPRYTEASLVKELEEKGIGRPSTYAPTLETIKKRYYILKEGKYLLPTPLGKTVTLLLVEHFGSIMDISFTAKLEDKLDSIEDGKVNWVEILREFWSSFEVDLKNAMENAQGVSVEPEETDVDCDKCGKKMVIRWGRYGKFMACSGFPECKNAKPILNRTGISCPREGCGGDVVERRARGRKFYGCSRYPECKFASPKKPGQELKAAS